MEINLGAGLELMGFITFIVLLILKCCNKLACSWFWVIFPLWLPLALILVIDIICVIVLNICD